ncbi:hypothetical protein BKA81DRAFT_366911 [Phyllosticta paracitricarpa]
MTEGAQQQCSIWYRQMDPHPQEGNDEWMPWVKELVETHSLIPYGPPSLSLFLRPWWRRRPNRQAGRPCVRPASQLGPSPPWSVEVREVEATRLVPTTANQSVSRCAGAGAGVGRASGGALAADGQTDLSTGCARRDWHCPSVRPGSSAHVAVERNVLSARAAIVLRKRLVLPCGTWKERDRAGNGAVFAAVVGLDVAVKRLFRLAGVGVALSRS